MSDRRLSDRTSRQRFSLDDHQTIALVDGNPASLVLGKAALAEQYNVLTADSGAGLLEMLGTHTPSLILLDVAMPDMDGLEIIKILNDQTTTQNIPVILMAESADEHQEIEGLSLGAVDYITKPFSPVHILQRVKFHLLVDARRRALTAQRQKLFDSNQDLHRMVIEKSATIVGLQEAIVNVFAELIERRDDVTGKHVERIQGYLHMFFLALLDNELFQEEVATWNIALILQAAHLHDVGKIAIRDDVLLKPDRLSEEEFEIIKTHVDFGEAIIDKIMKTTSETSFLEQARVLVTSHHEKWDGSGYPRGMKGTEIPLQGRVMAIVDVYDALVDKRPYKEAYSHDQAVQIIVNGSGTHFDPDLITVFQKISDQFRDVRQSA